VAQHVDAAYLDRRRLGVFVLVDHVLVERLRHELVGHRLHVGGDERGEVEARVAVEHQLVVHHLIGDLGAHLTFGQPVLRDARRLRYEHLLVQRLAGTRERPFGMLERHAVTSWSPVDTSDTLPSGRSTRTHGGAADR
jgi:hypothetical protein